MTITKKLLLTLFIALLSVLAVGSYGVWQLERAEDRFQSVSADLLPGLATLSHARNALAAMRLGVRDVILADNPGVKLSAVNRVTQAYQDFDRAMLDYRTHNVIDDVDQQLLATDETAMRAFRQANDQTIALAMVNAQQGLASMRKGPQATVAAYQALEAHYQHSQQRVIELSAQNRSSYELARNLSFAGIALAFLLTGGLSAQLYRTIQGGLRQIRNNLTTVSHSLNFRARAEVGRLDEIGIANQAFNHLLEKLQSSFQSLHDVAREVDRSSKQVMATARQVSTASTIQSEASSAMAATMEQMTVSVNHVAQQAQTTQAGAVESQKLVSSGAQVIHQTIQDIHEISAMVKHALTRIQQLEEDSRQVVAVIGVIREIADQTNLLALNASIEAARAGEYGRGFAVVADEVRKLAERTARSTQDISTTIQTMMTRATETTAQMISVEALVETGVNHANEANQAIYRIGDHAGRASDSIREIAAAIQQQGEASNNIAIQVEKTARMSEESRNGATETAESATYLDVLVKRQMATLALFQV